VCDRCAKKWTYGHKCAPMVQLHALQELYELFPDEETIQDLSSLDESEDSAQLCLFLSEVVLTGVESTIVCTR
jgi:hypothetical protein